MKKRNKMWTGFSLMEILVYVAILVIVVLAVSSFFLWTTRSNTKARAMREVLDNTRRITEVMNSEIKEAKSIYIPTSIFNSHPGQLSLETTKYLSGGETTTYIDFFICGTQLCLKKEAQDPITLTSDRVEVKKLEFIQIATTSTIPSIQINFKIDYKSPVNKPEYQATINTTSTTSIRGY